MSILNRFSLYPERLTDDQASVINKIATFTGMDCWFSLYYDSASGKEFVYDLEDKEFYMLRDGLILLIEGIDSMFSYASLSLSNTEGSILKDLCASFNIACSFF